MEFSNFSEFGGVGGLHSHLEEENQNHFEQGEHVERKLRNPQIVVKRVLDQTCCLCQALEN
jgi:hypothetical protein